MCTIKALLVNGSPHKEKCTYTALMEVSSSPTLFGSESDLKKQVFAAVLAICMTLQLCGCASSVRVEDGGTPKELADDTGAAAMDQAYTADTRITDVINAPVFGDHGRLIFPVDDGCWSGDTLGDLQLTWYSSINPAKTVEIANYMRTHAGAGDTIFYDIYTDEEKAADPAREDTGHSEYTENDPPTYACVGTSDGIASWRTMEARLNALQKLGIPTEFHTYEGLRHGFGLGTGTAAKRRDGRQHRTAASIRRAVAAREMGNTIMIVRKVGFFGNTQ